MHEFEGRGIRGSRERENVPVAAGTLPSQLVYLLSHNSHACGAGVENSVLLVCPAANAPRAT